jgi:hypothetical protein
VVLLVALSSGSAFSQVPAQRFESLGMEALRSTASFAASLVEQLK